jgi:heat shock protein HtpX
MQNNFRTFFLMTLLTVFFVWIGGQIGGQQGLIIAFIMAAVMNLGAYWFSDKMVLKQYRASEVGPESNSRLYKIVEKLVGNANMPMPKVYVVPNNSPNAFATGRNPNHAAVCATEGIMQILNDDELEGVMAHELTHVKNRDILTSTIAATFAGAITMVSRMGMYGGSRSSNNRSNPLLSILMLIAAPLASMAIRMLISRTREYSADAGGADISGKPLALASALKKLHNGVQRRPMQNVNPAHAHMFITNPFFGGMQKMFATHPPMEERVLRLEELAGSRQYRSRDYLDS